MENRNQVLNLQKNTTSFLIIAECQAQHTSAVNTQEHAQHAARKYQEEHAWEAHAKFAATATEKFATFAWFAAQEAQHKLTTAKDAKDQH